MRFQEFPFQNLDSARKFITSIRKSLSDEFVKFSSYKIQSKVINSDEFKRSKNIACFVGSKGEPDTSLILEQKNKNIFLPKVVSESNIEFFLYKGELKEGKFGIPEPKSDESVDIKNIELFLVPGLLFDKRGFRVGYGKGYYDKALSERKREKSNVWALAWSFQVFDKIEHNKSNDVFVEKIFTEVYVLNTLTGEIKF
ncbi:MAG: 5-formyltetrahydrofolate cyclo-ligase [Candidatus Calescibacterium sp.]|nr:5-formyltetrahydrofolate cyclo-ligase [Candidatus Calescibacterium sp.]MCX7733737.1 5-formyltetrahydrofolate cyclo-ligase [bacterium]MDW8086699.1 5-formyltetrahydrofolate cyclo-ligase [Candidatus Calescibacterium sp.]